MRQTQRRVVNILARVAASVVLIGGMLALPIDWEQLGRTATLLAVGMQRPTNTAHVLGDQPISSTINSDVMLPPAQADASGEGGALSVGGDAQESVSVLNVAPPAADGTGGKIVTRTISGGDTRRDGIGFRNSSGVSVDIQSALNTALTPRFVKTEAPQVLIIHTHTTEGYMTYDAGRYNAADRARTTDHRRSVCAAGEALKAALTAQGITAIHDTTVHDSPYSGAYTRSAKTVEKYLKQYPSIQLVLDVHRDALMEGERTLVKPTVTIDGKKAAQIMIIAGVLSTKALPNPHAKQNLALAAQWQQRLEQQYRGLTRPLSTVGSRYNQHLHAGYLLVEIGGEANTVEEAVYSATLLGKTVAELLREE